MEEKSLKEEIRELTGFLKEQHQGKKKEKGFRLPFRARLSKRNLRQGYVTVALVSENKNVEFVKKQIDEGAYTHKGQGYLATPETMLNYKGKPMLIQPIWRIDAFSPQEDLSEAEREKKLSVGYRLLLNMMMKEALADKKKMAGGMILLILVVVGIAVYMFSGGKLF